MFIGSLIGITVAIVLLIVSKLTKVETTIDEYKRKHADETQQAVKTGTKVTGWVIFGLSLPFFFISFFTIVPAGHVGIIDVFGDVKDATLDPGLNFVNPLAKVVKMNTQTQESKEDMSSPTKEGLTVGVDVSVLYHLNPREASNVYRLVGEDYEKTIIDPQFRSATRGVTAMHDAKALYTSERDSLAKAILDELVKLTDKRGLIVESILMRQIKLPEGLAASITQKLMADQESQRMEFVLLKEKQEAERKKIEAKGISDFQQIVTAGISEPLLKWKGIEATEKLALSTNSKIVIIGAGKDGLPVILNADK